MPWESLLAGALALAAIYFFLPGVRAGIKRSRDVESNWPAVVLPLIALIVFVFLLISIARN